MNNKPHNLNKCRNVITHVENEEAKFKNKHAHEPKNDKKAKETAKANLDGRLGELNTQLAELERRKGWREEELRDAHQVKDLT